MVSTLTCMDNCIDLVILVSVELREGDTLRELILHPEGKLKVEFYAAEPEWKDVSGALVTGYVTA